MLIGRTLPEREEQHKHAAPTTDAEEIVEFSQEQYRLAQQNQVKKKPRQEDSDYLDPNRRIKRPRTSSSQTWPEKAEQTQDSREEKIQIEYPTVNRRGEWLPKRDLLTIHNFQETGRQEEDIRMRDPREGN